jgi:hypothetical protein
MPIDKGLRVAIIGNMNNAGFVIMRYFRDLGVDAYLLPYSTDGSGNLSHFAPESDTWDIDCWKQFVRPLGIPNSSRGLLGNFPYFGSTSLAKLKNNLVSNYDVYIGHGGLSPALFKKMNLKLDVFFPYAAGIEFYGDLEFLERSKSSILRKLTHCSIRRLQAQGIRKTRYCLNAEMSITKDSFDKIGCQFTRLPVPAVYNGDGNSSPRLSQRVSEVIEKLKLFDLSIFSCSRLLWDKNTLASGVGRNYKSFNKNSDWLFVGLAKFVSENPKARPVVVCVEYGPDVKATKQLIDDLGLRQNVIWLPLLQRKEIILLLQACDIGVGEFIVDPGMLWGGTGWEVLSCSKPFLQSFNFSDASFESEFGYPPPPILDVKSAQDVARHLNTLYDDSARCDVIHKEASDWFKRYNGIGLAKQWLELLKKGDREI